MRSRRSIPAPVSNRQAEGAGWRHRLSLANLLRASPRGGARAAAGDGKGGWRPLPSPPDPERGVNSVFRSAQRVARWTLAVGGIGFALGFFGPMILAPDANQGPLLGMFYTGPLGLLAGFVIGVARTILGYTAGPREVFARTGIHRLRPTSPAAVLRTFAGAGGVLLAVHAVVASRDGMTRGVAASLVLAVVLLHHAATGRTPRWFFR
jgi:hypothetical protein